jgi:hypothetical protein
MIVTPFSGPWEVSENFHPDSGVRFRNVPERLSLLAAATGSHNRRPLTSLLETAITPNSRESSVIINGYELVSKVELKKRQSEPGL